MVDVLCENGKVHVNCYASIRLNSWNGKLRRSLRGTEMV